MRPPSDVDIEISGKEGRLLTRIHLYKERDRKLVARAKKHHRQQNNGRLFCAACNLDPTAVYGPQGERCIEAHHQIPIEELQPDSTTHLKDLAMVCASCHRVIHSEKPCLSLADVRQLLKKHGAGKQ